MCINHAMILMRKWIFVDQFPSVRCFKPIWKVGKVGKVGRVGKVGKVGREGLIMPIWNQLWLPVHCGILAISWRDFLSMLAQKTNNLFEFKYLHPNQTFSKSPQQNCSFISSPFLLDCCKIWSRIGNCYSRNLPSLPSLPTLPTRIC